MDENENIDTQPVQLEAGSNIKKQFTTVTILSKYLALALFITLPFLGFWIGLKYISDGEVVQIPDQQDFLNGQQDVKFARIDGCEELLYKESVDTCYFSYAQTRGEVGLCDFIVDNEERSQCITYVTPKVQKIELYTLGSSPPAIPVGQEQDVTFRISYFGTEESARVTLYRMREPDNSLEVVTELYDDGMDEDHDAGDYAYSGKSRIGPYSSEQVIRFVARVVWSDHVHPIMTSETHKITITNFPIGPAKSDLSKYVRDIGTLGEIFSNEILSNEVTVAFVDGTTPTRIREIMNSINGEVIGVLFGFSLDMYQVRIPDTGSAKGVYDAIDNFMSYEDVEWAEPNSIVSVSN